MEEPETAIPPYAQKRIVHEVRRLSSQTIFTSHSPYVLEEFDLEQTIVVARNSAGILSRATITLPDSLKLKRYRQEFRTRFCEGLLARRVLVAEGATEATSMPAAARRLSELDPGTYTSLEALGLCVVDAGGETNVADTAQMYKSLGKSVYAVCDKQPSTREAEITAQVDQLFMHAESTFEDLVLNNTPAAALKRFAKALSWPPHLQTEFPDPENAAMQALRAYFDWSKGNWGIADFLAQCSVEEIPIWVRETCVTLKQLCEPPPASDASEANVKAIDGEASDDADATD